jgi:hypothetical protein
MKLAGTSQVQEKQKEHDNSVIIVGGFRAAYSC